MLPAVEDAPARALAVDPALLLAEVICRLREVGVGISMDRTALAAAHGHWLALLDALGVQTMAGERAETDLLLLRCAAAPRRGDGARSA